MYPKFTTLADVSPGDQIVWNPMCPTKAYDIVYTDRPLPVVWCGYSWDKKSNIIDTRRSTSDPIPHSLKEAQDYLAALHRKGHTSQGYKIKEIVKMVGLTVSLVREIEEEDDDMLNIYATINSKEFVDSSFKKYTAKRDQEIIILTKGVSL
jgi:hypothetical protein